ncbi:hypothetical protein, partial [Pontiella sp.]|uniref:hypothetical protein n=1 Tax=Pontiella sp. TaxID=2837462 RepID=UPI003563221B
ALRLVQANKKHRRNKCNEYNNINNSHHNLLGVFSTQPTTAQPTWAHAGIFADCSTIDIQPNNASRDYCL